MEKVKRKFVSVATFFHVEQISMYVKFLMEDGGLTRLNFVK